MSKRKSVNVLRKIRLVNFQQSLVNTPPKQTNTEARTQLNRSKQEQPVPCHVIDRQINWRDRDYLITTNCYKLKADIKTRS